MRPATTRLPGRRQSDSPEAASVGHYSDATYEEYDSAAARGSLGSVSSSGGAGTAGGAGGSASGSGLSLEASAIVKVHDRGPPSSSKYDLCLAVRLDSRGRMTEDATVLLERLVEHFGTDYMYVYESALDNMYFILIRGNINKLKAKAERDRFQLPLDPVSAREMAFYGDEESNVEQFEIPHVPDISEIKPFQYIYGRYRSEPEFQSLYWKPEGAKNPFRRSIRVSLILQIIRDPDHMGGAGINLDVLVREKVLAAYYPLHDGGELGCFESSWAGALGNPWKQPIQAVREYFGEKVAMFFALLEHLMWYLLMPMVVGIIFEFLYIFKQDARHFAGVIYAFFIMFWSIFMLAYWRQRGAYISMYWGRLMQENVECVRSEFRGEPRKSAIDGTETLGHLFPRGCCYYFSIFNYVVTFLVMGISAAIAIYVLKKQIQLAQLVPGGENLPGWVISIITGVVVFLGNYFYHFIAVALTKLENHRTTDEFKKHLSIKLALFQFVNCFATSYYLAFIAPFMGPNMKSDTNFMLNCGGESCLSMLVANVAGVYGVVIVLKNLFFFVLPFFFVVFNNLVSIMAREDFEWLTLVKFCCCSFTSDKSSENSNDDSRGDDSHDKERTCGQILCCYRGEEEEDENNEAPDGGVQMWDIYQSSAKISGSGSGTSGGHEGETPESRKTNRGYALSGLQCIPELDFHLKPWDAEISYVGDVDNCCHLNFAYCELVSVYAEVAVALGFLFLFNSIVPGVSVLTFVDLFLMQRRHAWRLIHVYRRPVPEIQSAIVNIFFGEFEVGFWTEIFKCILFIAFITNAGLVFFTMPVFDSVELANKVWLFFGFHIIMVVVQYFVDIAVPRVPESISIQWQRNQFCNKRLIERNSGGTPSDKKAS